MEPEILNTLTAWCICVTAVKSLKRLKNILRTSFMKKKIINFDIMYLFDLISGTRTPVSIYTGIPFFKTDCLRVTK